MLPVMTTLINAGTPDLDGGVNPLGSHLPKEASRCSCNSGFVSWGLLQGRLSFVWLRSS